MRQTDKYILLGIGHGINDCVAGYLIGSLFYHGYAPLQLGIYTLLYNLIAFGGQLVFAKVLESFFVPKKYMAASFLLLAAALVLLRAVPELSILCAGIASAMIHVTGGMEALREDGKSFGIGIFASPGVIGLVAGGFLAYLHINFILTGLVLCVAYFVLLLFLYKPAPNYLKSNTQDPAIEGHDIIMVILITVISLRSFIWDVIQLVEQKNYSWLITIALAAMCGKLAGGLLADKLGHSRFSIYALLASIPFLTVFKKHLIALSLGVFLLQSTIPATTVMIFQAIRRKPALAIALSFGLSVFIAITLFYTPIINYVTNPTVIFLSLTLSILLLLTYHSRLCKTNVLPHR